MDTFFWRIKRTYGQMWKNGAQCKLRLSKDCYFWLDQFINVWPWPFIPYPTSGWSYRRRPLHAPPRSSGAAFAETRLGWSKCFFERACLVLHEQRKKKTEGLVARTHRNFRNIVIKKKTIWFESVRYDFVCKHFQVLQKFTVWLSRHRIRTGSPNRSELCRFHVEEFVEP